MRRYFPASLAAAVVLLAGTAMADDEDVPSCLSGQGTSPVSLNSHSPAPEDYPPLADMLGEEGKVVVGYDVLPNGTTGNITVETTSDSQRLDDGAVAFARRFRFKPATLDGAPIACHSKVQITWILDKKKPASEHTGTNALQPSRSDYPAEALANKEEETVTAMVTLNNKGKVTYITLPKPGESEALNDATLTYLYKQTFKPAEVNGAPLNSVLTVAVKWSLASP